MTHKPKQSPLPAKLLSLSEAAEILNCSLKTIRRRVDAGKLATIRDGGMIRVNPEDLKLYIQNHRFG